MPCPAHHRRLTASNTPSEQNGSDSSSPSRPPSKAPLQIPLYLRTLLPMLLLTTILTLWLTALPCLRAIPTTPSSPLHRRAPKCHEIPRHLTTPLSNLDCILALNELPTTHLMGGVARNPTDQVGTFSLHADPATQFRLPRHFAHGTCMIGVTMATTGVIGDEDSESWNRIAREALAVIRQCVQQPAPEDRVGGTEYVGAHGKIQLDVFANQRYLQFMVDLNKPPSPGASS